jgi:NhaA family Na+:H+ antiporter
MPTQHENSGDPQPLAQGPELRKEPMARITAALNRFIHVESASGIVLLLATAVAMILSNSFANSAMHHFWMTPIGIAIGSFEFRMSLEHWINDGLMAIFFFVIGLEVKRELVLGELRDPRRAVLPIAAAVGGMIVPAGVYLLLQHGKPGESGWGIPMATDIAFVVGCLAILGSRAPRGLRTMLLTLAIIDDIGAIAVIAIGYSKGIRLDWLALGLLGLVVVYSLTRLGIRRMAGYAVVGAFVWYAFLQSGVHATVAGVFLGLITPARSYVSQRRFAKVLQRLAEVFNEGTWDRQSHRAEQVGHLRWAARETISPLEYLEAALHPWVAFVIMPVFALANAGVEIRLSSIDVPLITAVALGLLLGKPLGIALAAMAAVKSGLAVLPDRVGWGMIVAGGALSGIGFTMALFIASLALDDALLTSGKVGVLLGSALSAAAGLTFLVALSRPAKSPGPAESGSRVS